MKIGTFFSGIGSPEQALKNLMLDGMEYKNNPLEIDIQFACEIDKYAKQTYLENFKPKNFYDDITKLDMAKIPYVDLLVGGFPCQAFSIAGNRLGFEDVRGTLFFDLLRYIKTQKPKYFILENVRGLLSHDKGKTFDVILKCLAKTLNNQISLFKYSDALNYNVHYQVLNTKDYGLPQNRERVFIIGIREDVKNTFRFPKKIPLKLKLKDILQDNPNFKYYQFTQLQKQMFNKDLNIKRYINSNKIDFFDVGDSADISFPNGYNKGNRVFKKTAPALTDTTIKKLVVKVDEKYYLKDETVNKLIKYTKRNKEKGNGFGAKFHDIEKDVMSSLKVGGTGADDLITVHSLYPRSGNPKQGGSGHLKKKDGTAYCLDTENSQAIEVDSNKDIIQIGNIVDTGNFDNPQRGKIVHKKRIRRLTPLECFRLQGFPDDFKKPCSDTQLYKQAGNTISVPVIESIILNLIQ
jgi:DNA (cytosine-5)-methyltransferase 1